MAIVLRRPRTPSMRHQSFSVRKDLDKKAPEKSLLGECKKTGGRNVYGRITSRHRGGGAKRLYRIIDFKREVRDIPGKVIALEYDPNRNVEIALVVFKNGAKKYVLRAEGVNKGSTILYSEEADAVPGNSLPLSKIPVGFSIHNVELTPGASGSIAKAAGSYAQVMGKDGGLVLLKMPSSEVRSFNENCWATVGPVANAEFRNISWGKAGRRRHLGWRPYSRGIAKNPVDHPMGGGEGRSKSASHSTSPWGKNTKGTITRKRFSKAIIKRRVKRRK